MYGDSEYARLKSFEYMFLQSQGIVNTQSGTISSQGGTINDQSELLRMRILDFDDFNIDFEHPSKGLISIKNRQHMFNTMMPLLEANNPESAINLSQFKANRIPRMIGSANLLKPNTLMFEVEIGKGRTARVIFKEL